MMTIPYLLVGLGVPALLAYCLHRQRDINYGLALPGMIAGTTALIAGALLQAAVAQAMVGAATAGLPAGGLPLFAGLVGFPGGLLIAGLLTAILLWLAPGARTYPALLMIGVGYGGTEIAIRAILTLIAALQASGAADPALSAYPLLEVIAALSRLASGVAVTLLIGSMFLTGAVGWFFAGTLWAALLLIGPIFFGHGGPLPAAIWWTGAGAISLFLILWRRPSRE